MHHTIFASLLAWLFFGNTVSAQSSFQIPLVFTADQSALLVPVTLKTRPAKRRQYLQLDLGAPKTVFYRSPENRGMDSLFNIDLLIQEMPAHFNNIAILHLPVSDSIIGTLGADLFDGKVAIFNYPKKQLILAESLPEKFRGTLQPFHFVGGRILLPAVLDGKSILLFFDTGSSAFNLVTDSATAGRFSRKGEKPLINAQQSWGKTLTAYTHASDDSIGIAGFRLPLHTVSWISGSDPVLAKRMRQAGIGGMAGNALFLNQILVLDMKRKEFGLAGAR